MTSAPSQGPFCRGCGRPVGRDAFCGSCGERQRMPNSERPGAHAVQAVDGSTDPRSRRRFPTILVAIALISLAALGGLALWHFVLSSSTSATSDHKGHDILADVRTEPEVAWELPPPDAMDGYSARQVVATASGDDLYVADSYLERDFTEIRQVDSDLGTSRWTKEFASLGSTQPILGTTEDQHLLLVDSSPDSGDSRLLVLDHASGRTLATYEFSGTPEVPVTYSQPRRSRGDLTYETYESTVLVRHREGLSLLKTTSPESNPVWTYRTDEPVATRSLVLDGKLIPVITGEGEEAITVLLDVETGGEADGFDNVQQDARVRSVGRTLFVTTNTAAGQVLHVFDEFGDLKWKAEADAFFLHEGPMGEAAIFRAGAPSGNTDSRNQTIYEEFTLLNPDDGSHQWGHALRLDFYRIYGGLDGQTEVAGPGPRSLVDAEAWDVVTTLVDTTSGRTVASLDTRVLGYRGSKTYYGVDSDGDTLMGFDTFGDLLWSVEHAYQPLLVKDRFVTFQRPNGSVIGWSSE